MPTRILRSEIGCQRVRVGGTSVARSCPVSVPARAAPNDPQPKEARNSRRRCVGEVARGFVDRIRELFVLMPNNVWLAHLGNKRNPRDMTGQLTSDNIFYRLKMVTQTDRLMS